MNWYLKYFQTIDGKSAYFKNMTGIGPALTKELSEAQAFESEMEALKHPAATHPLCLLEPEHILRES